MDDQTRSTPVVKVILIALGVVLLATGVAIGVSVRRFTHAAVSADGVVVRLNAGGSHPQINFVTAAGKIVSYPQGGFVFGARPGDKVRVLYIPDDPTGTAHIDTFGSLWFVPLLLLAIGISLVVAAACVRVPTQRM